MPRLPGVLAIIATLIVAGCAVGPNYRRPVVRTPITTRGQVTPTDTVSLADLPWWAVFDDPVLQALIDEALRDSPDLLAAAARVERARNLVIVARADMLPQASYQAEASRQRAFAPGGPKNEEGDAFLATFNLVWEIDVWGRIRRATEAARAELAAEEHTRRGVLLTLVTDVARAYFDLLELDRDLQIDEDAVRTFSETADLFERRYEGGIGTLLEVSRGRAALADARAELAETKRLRAIRENQLSALLGDAPRDIGRGTPLSQQRLMPDVPVGLPSQLLERRPDVRQAEQTIIAANAEVGVAVASFFPKIGLTSLYGGQSAELENLVKSSGNIWAIAGSLSGPIFQGGRLVGIYRANKAGWDETIERYRRTVLDALAEVASTLTTHEQLKDVSRDREASVTELETSVRLSLQRYTDGIANYFEVLEAQQQLFPAARQLARSQRDQLVAVVDLYRALGGGWDLQTSAWLSGGGTPALP